MRKFYKEIFLLLLYLFNYLYWIIYSYFLRQKLRILIFTVDRWYREFLALISILGVCIVNKIQ